MRSRLLGITRGRGLSKLWESRVRRWTAIAAFWAALAGGGVSGANAASLHEFAFSFDGSETPAGSLVQAGSVAVSRASEDVYVADIGSEAIDVFGPTGKYLFQITGAETLAGAFALTAPAGIAVDNSTEPEDPSAGDVYVVDGGNGVIDKFSPEGAYLGHIEAFFGGTLFGVGVDHSGHLWVADSSHEISEFTNSGVSLLKYATATFFEPPFMVDSNGNSLVSSFSGVEKFSSTGHLEGLVDGCALCQTGLGTDFATDDIYSDDHTVIREASSSRQSVVEFGESQLASGGEGGIGIAPVTGKIYVANAADKKVYVFAPAPGPRALSTATTGISVRSATLRATVLPEGAETTYQFEYGTSEFDQKAPLAPGSAGSGTAPVPVEAQVEGLEGSTTYRYRIVATNEDGTFRGAERTFTTAPIPDIESASATDVSGRSATLNAVINARGLEGTTYRFEWGESTSYGHVAPVPDGSVAPSGPTEVSQPITGLTPGVTSHWRVVVNSSNGSVTGVDHTFVYTSKAALPDGRQYEMVSPVKKNGALLGDSFLLGGPATISADGSRVITTTLQCFAGSEGCTANRSRTGTPVEFTRSPVGWLTTPLARSAAEFEAVTYWKYGATEGSLLFSAPNPETQEDDFYVRDATGLVRRIGPQKPAGVGSIVAEFGEPGMNRLYWVANKGAEWPFDGTIGERPTIYEETAGASHPNLVAVTGGRESTDLIVVCGEEPEGGPGTLSDDGSTYFFVLPACEEGGTGANAGVALPTQEIFARRNGEETVPISEPASNPRCTTAECLANVGPEHESRFRPARLAGSSSDGKDTVFLSTQQLTDQGTQDETSSDKAEGGGCEVTTGTGCNLYDFECAACSNPAERRLVDVSAGDTSGEGPRVRGVLTASADGSHVYFVAGGVLTNAPNATGQFPKSGRDNLYVYERDTAHPGGSIAYIANLENSDSEEWSEGGGYSANVTPDGRYLVFLSRGRLTSDDTSRSGALQVFRFDSVTSQLIRISVGAKGYNDNGNRSSPAVCGAEFCAEDARIVPGNSVQPLTKQRLDPTMSDDGSYVFFQSPVALTPGALDDVTVGVGSRGQAEYALNVYEWHDGEVSLISDGHDASADAGQSLACIMYSSVCLLGTDSTGQNVFFSTVDSLVSQDTDTELDYYDARICTAASPCISAPGAVKECDGEGCHGAPSVPPVFGTPASATFNGPRNVVPEPPVKQKRLTRAEKLAKALKACHTKRNKHKRLACEKQARKRYSSKSSKGRR